MGKLLRNAHDRYVALMDVFERWVPPPTRSIHPAMLSLTEWFVRNIPYSFDFLIDHHAATASNNLDSVLERLQRMDIGCRCGGLAHFMARLAWREGYKAFEINFGDAFGPASHVIVLVFDPTYGHVIYDPTFGRFSADPAGQPLSVESVIEHLRDRRGHDLRWSKVGPRERRVIFGSNVPTYSLSDVSSIDDERRVATIDIDHHAEETFEEMRQWSRGRHAFDALSFFDLLRFPISTSGEAEVESIAEDLRRIA